MNNEQTKWVLDYEVRLNELFCEIDWDYNGFTSANDFDPLDVDKDNFSAAGIFSSKFVDALEGGYFDSLFDSYYEKRLNDTATREPIVEQIEGKSSKTLEHD